MIFAKLELRNRGDAVTLLSFVRCPTPVISDYINDLELKLSLDSYPYAPWIHTLNVEGPLPPNKAMTGIHDMVRHTLPQCSSGLKELSLDNIQFRSFVDIMRTIGDMPDLRWVDFHKVTWNDSRNEELRPPTARRTRFQQVSGCEMFYCTDNAAVVWLRLLLICPGSDRLDEVDADRLYRTTSLLANGGRRVGCRHHSDLGPDTFYIRVALHRYETLDMYVLLTSRMEGQPRHVRAIAFQSGDFEETIDFDWKEVDNLIASLSTLETLLFVFRQKYHALPEHRDAILRKMAHFKDSPKLKYALNFESYHNYTWAQVACADDGSMKEIGPRYDASSPHSVRPSTEFLPASPVS
ncbi:hypothetical protein NM688_g8030 [Phlebia brevispora]|uniref:Uncharacterized protein n=1 Tax=Phlebia brevispora TaxID=194682 RepID=A0ACC1RYG0_9APHY|nr:hypothetical protein NM688_g8030 [Phlebia brevispora]